MKTIFAAALIFITSNLYGQWGTAAIKLGHFNPSASDGGFIVGFEGGKYIDEGFNIGWSVDWFHKNYVDKKLVVEYNNAFPGGSETNELRAKTNLHDLPFMVTLTAKYPVAPMTSVFLTGGIGAEVLIINYRNFQNPTDDEFKAAFDFNWRLGFGGSYEVGKRSDIFAELTYHSSSPSWEYEIEDNGTKRYFERVFDMSGVMFRLGFRFYY